MSTRAQIEFRHSYKDEDGKETTSRRTIYRHSDGYPNSVIADLKEFLKWNSGRNGDVEYMAANFIYWSKRRFEDRYLRNEIGLNKKGECRWDSKHVEQNGNSILKLGFGICNNDELHGDIEYFYEVCITPLLIDGRSKIIINAYKKGEFGDIKKDNLQLIKTIEVKNE